MIRERRTSLGRAILGIFIFLSCILIPQNVYGIGDDDDIQNVLILNSYHQGFTWTEEETEGIIDKLRESGNNISILVEYMDWKNYNSDENMDYLYQYLSYKYKNKKIDIIIATDDAALKFALESRSQIFSEAPVVFCGVNKEGVNTITKGYDRFTGVLEVVDPSESLKIAHQINPSLKNIYLLYDNSESGLSTGSMIIKTINKYDPDLKAISWNNIPFQEINQMAKELGDDSIILIGTYYSDVNNTILDMDYVTREICSNSSVPVYHLYDFGLNNGIIGGALLSAKLQGENAAKMAIRILEGEDPNEMTIMIPNSTRTVFDYNQLKSFGISLNTLPKNSEIINKPFSFYGTYKGLVLGVITAFIILIVFVSILLFYIRKIQKMKKSLTDSHEELTQIYEELAASDEEMKQQYDEMITINEKIRLGEEKLAYLAYHDMLTGLPNKLSLYEHSYQIFASKDKMVALLFIDIDNFKYVNDTLGHAFGDKLIVKVGERLTALLRDNCSLYRLSGDEFIIIVSDIKEKLQAEEYASYLLSDFLKDFDSLNSNIHVNMSLGIALYPEHGCELEQLLKYADIAMYQAKAAGRKSYVVYDQIMNEVFMERVMIEKNLQKALDHNEFVVYYQPQLDVRTNKITGFEALLRWNSPELGAVPPLKFIKVAEDTHFIIPLGTWVLHRACEFLNRLEENGYKDLTVSVNISILQLLQADFLDIVEDTLHEHQIESERLELEITESILMESFERIVSRLKKLRDKKVRLALDDFGKGYSSLNYLKQLPITTMKVDKTFIDHITENNEDDFVGHIISIGKNMGMSVVAEGVEVQCQLDYLARHDCDKIQGYLFSKPVPEADIHRMLLENK
jgi:diguanylate cyclase (GGDEF)-like protein